MLSAKFDDLTEDQLKEAALAFFRSAEDKSDERDSIQYNYNCLLPRVSFLKNLPEDATVLDLGAGDGSLTVFRDWPLHKRRDLRLLALSLIRGAFYDEYDAVELKNFETTSEIFPNEIIDAVICCHFIEHMVSPEPTIKFLKQRLKPGARVYLEWPHKISKKVPDQHWLRGQGINVSTTRFNDDKTHVETWDMDHIVGLLRATGFRIEGMSRIILPYASNQLRDASMLRNEETGNTLAFWTYFGWAQYVICERI